MLHHHTISDSIDFLDYMTTQTLTAASGIPDPLVALVRKHKMITLPRSPALDHGPYVQGAQGDGLSSLMVCSFNQGRLCTSQLPEFFFPVDTGGTQNIVCY